MVIGGRATLALKLVGSSFDSAPGWLADQISVLDNSGNENNLLVVKSNDRPFSQPNDTDTQAARDRNVTTAPRTLEHPKHPSLVEEKSLSNTADCLRKGLIPIENNLSKTQSVNGSNQDLYGLSKLQEHFTETSNTTITSLIGSDVTPNCHHGEQQLGNEKDEDTPVETNHYQSSSEPRIRPNGNRRRETEEKVASNEKPRNSEISKSNVKSIWQWFVSWISFVYIRILGKRD